MSNLRITFTGLCVFAFNHPLKGTVQPTEVTLLMQKLTTSTVLLNRPNQKQESLDQHFPMLRFDIADRDKMASTRLPDFAAAPDARGDMTKGVCLLFEEDLTIRPDGFDPKSNSLKFDRNRPQSQDPATMSASDRETLWWVATLEDAFPGQGQINPIYINNPPDATDEILARVRLTEGTLKTVDLSPDPVRFVFGSPTFQQRVAIRLELSVFFRNFVEIGMETRDDKGQVHPLKLVLTPATANGDIAIDLQNLEIDSTIGIPASWAGKRPEADFEIYAHLLQTLPALSASGGPLPFLMPLPGSSSSGMSGSLCPPTA